MIFICHQSKFIKKNMKLEKRKEIILITDDFYRFRFILIIKYEIARFETLIIY